MASRCAVLEIDRPGERATRSRGADRDAVDRSKGLLGRALEAAALPVIVFECRTDDCLIRYVNRAFERRTGYTRAELRGLGGDGLDIEAARDRGPERLLAAIREARELTLPVRLRAKNGRTMSAELHVSPLPVANELGPASQTSRFAVGVLRERCPERQYLRALEHDAHHDPLTGLANRRLLAQHAREALARAHREHQALGVALIDLDAFKAVNDTLGHAAGDEVLRTVAGRLLRDLRPGDFVARLGGDEFVLLLPHVSGYLSLASLIERLRSRIEHPICVHGQMTVVGCSIGVAVCPTDAEDFEALLAIADRALYRQKTLRCAEAGCRPCGPDEAQDFRSQKDDGQIVGLHDPLR